MFLHVQVYGYIMHLCIYYNGVQFCEDAISVVTALCKLSQVQVQVQNTLLSLQRNLPVVPLFLPVVPVYYYFKCVIYQVCSHCSHSIIMIDLDVVEEIAGSNNGTEFKWATDADERNKLWKARHDIVYACTSLIQGSKVKCIAAIPLM